MSGSGPDSPDWRPIPPPKPKGKPPPGVPPACDLAFETPLNSPDRAVVQRLRPGERLRVELRTTNGVSLLLAVSESGDVAGSITSAQMAQIIVCIQDYGVQYTATVLRIVSGQCMVRVSPTGGI